MNERDTIASLIRAALCGCDDPNPDSHPVYVEGVETRGADLIRGWMFENGYVA